MNDPGQMLLLLFGVLCLLPLLIMVVIGLVVYRAGQQRLEAWLGPDVAKLQQRYTDLRAHHPDASQDALAAHIVHEQALRCGVIGAVTSLGGFVTLPVTLPIDIVLSLRIEAALINFLAHLYGGSSPEGVSATLRGYLVMAGSRRATQTTTRALTRLALQVVGESFSKLIPVVGALIGFGVNYFLVQTLGRSTLRWYARHQAGKSPAA